VKNSPDLNWQQTVPLTWVRSSQLRDLQRLAAEQSWHLTGARSTSMGAAFPLEGQVGRNEGPWFPCIQTLLGGLF